MKVVRGEVGRQHGGYDSSSPQAACPAQLRSLGLAGAPKATPGAQHQAALGASAREGTGHGQPSPGVWSAQEASTSAVCAGGVVEMILVCASAHSGEDAAKSSPMHEVVCKDREPAATVS